MVIGRLLMLVFLSPIHLRYRNVQEALIYQNVDHEITFL